MCWYFISLKGAKSLCPFFLRRLDDRSRVSLEIVPVGYDTDRVRHLVRVGCRVICLNNRRLLLLLRESKNK